MKKTNKKAILITIFIALAIILCILLTLKLLKEKRENDAIPVINLIGDSSIKLELNESYVENGATANLQDQDITGRIQKTGDVDTTKVGRYQIKYYVSNSKNKNQVEATRTIDVVDSVKPELKLKGDEKISIYVGTKYEEQGVVAIDNYDGDITDKVVISGEVDTSKTGEYVIKYYVQDSSANASEITRTVTVKLKPTQASNTQVSNSKSGQGIPILMYHFFYDKNVSSGGDGNCLEISDFEEQMKYLSENKYYFPTWQELEDFIDGKITLPQKSVVITADDGDPSFFDLAVPIIKKYNVKATSFVISSWYGWNAIKYKSENIDLQSHTFDMHKAGSNGKGIFLTKNYEEALEDIKKSQNELGGSSVIALAYPFGHYNEHTKKVLSDAGIKLAVTTKDGKVYKGSNKLELPRKRISNGISLNAFKNIVN